MTRQVETKLGGFRGVMRSGAFVRGFNEARKGKPMDYDAYQETGQTNARWAYERGRLFGLLFNGPLKEGPRITWPAYAAFRDAYNARLIR
jgi:hypothetical protein